MQTEKRVSLTGRKLMIAIPAYDGKLNIQSAFELPRLALMASKYGFEIELVHLSGCSIITRARNSLVNQFMTSNATEMLFIDADIRFKAEDVIRIMALGSDKDVLAGPYPRRAKDQMFFCDIWHNEHGGVELTEEGLLRVKRIGTGFMFIRRHVIEAMQKPEWKYWVDVENAHHYAVFDFKVTPEGYVGEDYLFCDRVNEAGFAVYIDTSMNLGHYGSTEFVANFEEQVLRPMIENALKAQEK